MWLNKQVTDQMLVGRGPTGRLPTSTTVPFPPGLSGVGSFRPSASPPSLLPHYTIPSSSSSSSACLLPHSLSSLTNGQLGSKVRTVMA